jgi:hypothetical protein
LLHYSYGYLSYKMFTNFYELESSVKSDTYGIPESQLIGNLRLIVELPTNRRISDSDLPTDIQVHKELTMAQTLLLLFLIRTYTVETPWSYIQVW